MRKIETQELTGNSGKNYAMNVYPADMRFNDFIPGVFVLMSGEGTLFIGDSDNVDFYLQKNKVFDTLKDEGFERIGFIKNGSPAVRADIMDDIKPVLSPSKSEL